MLVNAQSSPIIGPFNGSGSKMDKSLSRKKISNTVDVDVTPSHLSSARNRREIGTQGEEMHSEPGAYE